MKFKNININDLNIQKINKKSISYLFKSTKEFGILQPVIVKQNKDSYQVIAGERRINIAKEMGLDTIPAIILEDDDNFNNYDILILIENLIRKRNIAKEAEVIAELVKKGYDLNTISKITGINLREIKKLYQLSVSLIPELMEKLKIGEISSSCAFCLMKLSPEEQKSLLSEKRITLSLVSEKVKQKKFSIKSTLQNFTFMFNDINKKIELERLKQKIKELNITKEELFEIFNKEEEL